MRRSLQYLLLLREAIITCFGLITITIAMVKQGAKPKRQIC